MRAGVGAALVPAACLLPAGDALGADGSWSSAATLSNDHAGEPQVAMARSRGGNEAAPRTIRFRVR